jgi:hypothetical protein
VTTPRAQADPTGGVALAEAYYRDLVAPLLARRWPTLPHAAARLGSGSDVLGFDDPVSRDHDWGLRLTLLVDEGDVEPVDAFLQQQLPDSFHGWPTRFDTSWKAGHHQVEVATAHGFAESRLGVATDVDWDVTDWLSVTGQSVLEVTGGAVFRDSVGTITEIRRRLAWYPPDIWRYVVAADWQRIGQELPFVGRTGSRGDDLGSRLLTGHLVRVAVHLGFLLQRRWPPYSKWFGAAFGRLPLADTLLPACTRALAAITWPAREAALVDVLEALHAEQRGVGLPTGPTVVEPFFQRGFASVAGSATELLLAGISDPAVRQLPPGVGSVEQYADNVDVLSHAGRRRALQQARASR